MPKLVLAGCWLHAGAAAQARLKSEPFKTQIPRRQHYTQEKNSSSVMIFTE